MMERREAIKITARVIGAAISAPVFFGVISSCESPPRIDWIPKYISLQQAVELEAIVETLLPATDTPGAKEAGVPAFVEKLVFETFNPEEKKMFLEGLNNFIEKVKTEHNGQFFNLDPTRKLEIIQLENRNALNSNESENKPWILVLKALTLEGFFTSEIGATQVLNYIAVPGDYRACVPYAELGKAWVV